MTPAKIGPVVGICRQEQRDCLPWEVLPALYHSPTTGNGSGNGLPCSEMIDFPSMGSASRVTGGWLAVQISCCRFLPVGYMQYHALWESVGCTDCDHQARASCRDMHDGRYDVRQVIITARWRIWSGYAGNSAGIKTDQDVVGVDGQARQGSLYHLTHAYPMSGMTPNCDHA
jgi:hypothetical protein